MASFFEKLKRGMGVEEIEKEEESPQEKIEAPKEQPKKEMLRKPKAMKIKAKPAQPVEAKELELPKEEIAPAPEPKIELRVKEDKEVGQPAFAQDSKTGKEWFKSEGELAIDVYQTENELVIQSAIAGVRPENLEVSIEKDIITIKGLREKPCREQGDYFTQECYWGSFSRELVLPAEIDPERALAGMKEGVLTVRLPKISREKKRKIVVSV